MLCAVCYCTLYKWVAHVSANHCQTTEALSRHRFETDAAAWHPCGIWRRVFCLSARRCPITSCQRHISAVGARDARFYPTHALAGRLTRPTSTGSTIACGVCFRSEYIVGLPRSRMSTNWYDASRTSGQIWVALLLNVLLSSGASVCALAFALEADISSICCKDGVTYYTFDDLWETTGLTAALVCRYSMIELKCTCNYIALTANSDTSNFPR